VETTRGRRTTAAAALAALLAAAVLPLIARAADLEAVFVGHYGEPIASGLDENVSTRMRGHIEDIRIYPKGLQPTDADYLPQNFQRFGLKELLVVPVSFNDDLGDLLTAVENSAFDARSQGRYASAVPPQGRLVWPDDSAESIYGNFKTADPSGPRQELPGTGYWQILSQERGVLYIWTTGRDPAGYDDPDLASLDRYLMRLGPAPLPLERWRDIFGDPGGWMDEAISDHPLSGFLGWIAGPGILLLANAAVLLLLFPWDLRSKPGARSVLLHLVCFGNAFAAFTLAAALFEIFSMAGLFKNYGMIFSAELLLAAGAGWLLARRRKAERARGLRPFLLLLSCGALYWLCASAIGKPMNSLPGWVRYCPLYCDFSLALGAAFALVFSLTLTLREAPVHEND